MELREEGVHAFFAYARERHRVYLRKSRGDPKPWTEDKIIQTIRFTCIFREQDRTTQWCKTHVRNTYQGMEEVLPAVVLFRWFNKIETGQAMFSPSQNHGPPFTYWMHGAGSKCLKEAILRVCGGGPYTNGAYIVKSPNGMTKLDGILWAADQFLSAKIEGHGWREAASAMVSGDWNLEMSWDWLRKHKFQGDFTAYEVITDLRHTFLLRRASDIMTWANAGPGAVRGLNRIMGLPVEASMSKKDSLAGMQLLLKKSNQYWPAPNDSWPAWEMREVEHTLCEFDKYARVRLGEGSAKQKYNGVG